GLHRRVHVPQAVERSGSGVDREGGRSPPDTRRRLAARSSLPPPKPEDRIAPAKSALERDPMTREVLNEPGSGCGGRRWRRRCILRGVVSDACRQKPSGEVVDGAGCLIDRATTVSGPLDGPRAGGGGEGRGEKKTRA